MNLSREQLLLLVQAVQELSLARDLKSVMEIVRNKARELTGSDGATFVLRENDLCHYADENAIEPLWKDQKFPMSACISGWVMLNKRTAVIEDIYADGRIPAAAYKPTFVKSLVMVPIRTIKPIGAIGNYWASHHKVTEDEIFLLQSLADATSVAMENICVHDTLEQMVKRRTEQLEDAIKTLQTFNYSVSHDLKAPLRTFQGYTKILIKNHSTNLSQEGKELLYKVKESAEDMSELLSGLMDFSKVASTSIKPKDIPMDNLVSQMCGELKNTQKGREIQFNIRDLPSAKGDPVLMKQVMYNLLSNAVKYTRKKVAAHIEIGAKFAEKELIYFVKDNGDGFDMKYSNKLFQIFQRLHSQEDFDGTGVGLALVERIISKHGGRVWAEGIPGQGAIFYFSLPLNPSLVA